MKLFSKRKSRGIGSRDRRPGPRCQCIGSQHSELISAIESVMRGCDFMRVKGYFTSNLVHRSRDGRPGLYRVVRAVTQTEHPAAFHGRQLKLAEALLNSTYDPQFGVARS
jgi:hypothetical protein